MNIVIKTKVSLICTTIYTLKNLHERMDNLGLATV